MENLNDVVLVDRWKNMVEFQSAFQEKEIKKNRTRKGAFKGIGLANAAKHNNKMKLIERTNKS